jgi:tRNA(fMet)-specific endonuclease VapC
MPVRPSVANSSHANMLAEAGRACHPPSTRSPGGGVSRTILLDTDTLSLLMHGHERLVQRVAQQTEPMAITIVARIEILQCRFASLLKAADGERLLAAQHWLEENEAYLSRVACLPFDQSAATTFDRLRDNTSLRKIGRADLLIASIALSRQATLVTRNRKHFERIPGLRVGNWTD